MKKPTPDLLAQAQCHGKHRFDDARLAKDVARKSSRRKESAASAYRCSTCGGWHIGNGPRIKKKDTRNKHRD